MIALVNYYLLNETHLDHPLYICNSTPMFPSTSKALLGTFLHGINYFLTYMILYYVHYIILWNIILLSVLFSHTFQMPKTVSSTKYIINKYSINEEIDFIYKNLIPYLYMFTSLN